MKQSGKPSSNASQEWCSIRPDQLEWIGDAIRPGTYVQHSVFKRVTNYICETGLVSLVDQSVGAGPFNLVVSRVPDLWPRHIVITDTTISFDDVTVKSNAFPVYPSSLKTIGLGAGSKVNPSESLGVLRANIEAIKRWLITQAPPKSLVFLLDATRLSEFTTSVDNGYAQRMVQVAQTWQSGAFTAAVAMAKGSGFGATPAGDDFNAGLIIGLHLLKRFATGLEKSATVSLLDRLIPSLGSVVLGTNPLVNAFLTAAVKGQVNELQKELIRLCIECLDSTCIDHVEKMVAIGATSGADWLTGFVFIFEKEFESWLSLAE